MVEGAESKGKAHARDRGMRSDMAVCKEVLINRVYASSHRIFKAKKKDKVLDLGGNTGLASAVLPPKSSS